MDIEKLFGSEEYQNVEKEIEKYKRRLAKAGSRREVREIHKEFITFFKDLEEKNRELCSLFQVERKELMEKIIKKLTGENIIVD